ncbi:hypothetical protein BRC63_00340 [Halobacteriales archaeon QH_10_70_21]|nr:MAG: hypothetical protein BRC63_00340 [Halobacteriales archaeon QH_10_70_21]
MIIAGCPSDSDGGNGGNDGDDSNGGNGGNGGNGDMDDEADDFMSAAEQLGLGENFRQRRIENARTNWPVEDRQDTPDQQNDTTWTESGAFQSALEADAWSPPEGWDDTAAGDVDSITILNHGAANMEFDPATLAAHEYFTEVTGIDIETIEIGVEQATQREQQVLSSEEGSPQAFNVDGPLKPEFVERGYLEVTDALYPEGGFEPYIPALESLVSWELDPNLEGEHTYGYPNIVEASLGHLRPDLVEEQGLDPATYTEGEWTWDDLEELMAAFEGADQFGYAYYAGDAVYLSYSFRELLYQQGGRMVQEDGTVRMDTDAAIRVVQKMREWRENGWVPGDVLSYGEGNIVDLFTSGQLAFATGFSDFVPARGDAVRRPEAELSGPVVGVHLRGQHVLHGQRLHRRRGRGFHPVRGQPGRRHRERRPRAVPADVFGVPADALAGPARHPGIGLTGAGHVPGPGIRRRGSQQLMVVRRSPV